MLEEWEAVDRAAVAYLAQRIPDLGTISPAEYPEDPNVEAVAAING